MTVRIPFTNSISLSPGETNQVVAAPQFGYRVEVDSMFISTDNLTSGGPYIDTVTLTGLVDSDGTVGSVVLNVVIATTVSNYEVSVSGTTPRSVGITYSMTDASSGASLTGANLVVSGAYVQD